MHNRWHPDLEPIAEVAPGEEIRLEAEDGLAAQLTRESTHADAAALDLGLGHPLAGPVYVKGAEPGQVLEVEFVAYESADFGVTGVIPGFGFLADLFPEPYLVKWEIADGVARSEELPGVAVPEELFAGVVGVAPSHERLRGVPSRARSGCARRASRSPTRCRRRPFRPRRRTACGRSRRARPAGTWTSASSSPAAGSGCRSTCRARSSRSATSTSRRATARSAGRRSRSPAPSPSASRSTTARRRRCRATRRRRGRSRRSFATMGIPVETGMDLNAAARAALLEMIDHLEQRYGFERPAAYALAASPSTSGSRRSSTCPIRSCRRCCGSTCSKPASTRAGGASRPGRGSRRRRPRRR